jgi:hypothetical protein
MPVLVSATPDAFEVRYILTQAVAGNVISTTDLAQVPSYPTNLHASIPRD